MATQSNKDEQHGNSEAQSSAINPPETASSGQGVPMISTEGKKLLEEYSNIAPEDVMKHVTGVVNIPPSYCASAAAATNISPQDECSAHSPI